MKRVHRRWLVWLSIFGALLVILSFAAAAIGAEGALHPLLRRRASDTAALAYSIAESANARAVQVAIRGKDGTRLNAWWLTPAQTNGRAVVVCHGVADSAYGALGFALLFLRHGYSVLVPESRGHGESGGYVTYGVLEADDTVLWLGWMKGHGVQSAFGFGESLGGAILIQSLAKSAGFRALVVECPYSSFEAVARERVSRFIPAWASYILVNEALLYTHLRHGVDLRSARPDLAIRCAHIPILLIHGLADHETSPDNSRRLAKENPAFTELWLVPGAGHTGAYAADPNAFQQRVLAQFDTVQ